MRQFILLFFISFNAVAAGNILSFHKGKVWVNGIIATKKQRISFGDEIRTGKKSLAIVKVKPGATLKVKANSKMIVEIPKKSKSGVKLQSFILKAGELFINANSSKKQRFRVKSRNAVFGVRGTQFFVSAIKKSDVWMCVNEGVVAVKTKSSGKKAILVKEGEGVVVNSPKLPTVRKYNWTKTLNWKMDGSYKEILDTTVIEDINYDIESFDYD